MLSEYGRGCIACAVVTWRVWIEKWKGGCLVPYVLIRASKIRFCVSVCVSFNCNAFLVSSYISKRSSMFNLCPSISQHVELPWFGITCCMHIRCKVCVVQMSRYVCCVLYPEYALLNYVPSVLHSSHFGWYTRTPLCAVDFGFFVL
jgi:hypothetical protein